MDKNWKVILAFAGVFVAGGVCGGFVVQQAARYFRPAPRSLDFWPQMSKRLETKLELTQEQREKIRPIVQRAQEETSGLRREHVLAVTRAMERMHADIAALLTPAQREKLEDMRRKLRERIARERAQLRGNDPSGAEPKP